MFNFAWGVHDSRAAASSELIRDLLQLLAAGFGPTLPISNVRYHGEYQGYSGRAADIVRTTRLIHLRH
jgi:hypothetical protein